MSTARTRTGLLDWPDTQLDQIDMRRALAAMLRHLAAAFVVLPDRGRSPRAGDLPPEYFRFPPV